MNTKEIAHPVTELSAVSKSFRTAGGHELKVLENIDLAVNQGELLALLGQFGSRKSTILRCLTGLVEPTSGRAMDTARLWTASIQMRPSCFRPLRSIDG